MILVFFGLICIAFQTTLLNIPGTGELQPNFTLLFIVYLVLFRGPVEGAILTLVFARILEIHSGVPAGIIPFMSLCTYFLGRLISKAVLIPDLYGSIPLVFGLSLFWRMGITIGTTWKEVQVNWFETIVYYLLPGLIIHTIIAIPFFLVLKKIDRWTGKGLESASSVME